MNSRYHLFVLYRLLLAVCSIISTSFTVSTSPANGHSPEGRAREHGPVDRKMILFLINGFANYWLLDERRLNLSGFTRLKMHGTRAGYLQPDFPTLSLPNQYSLLTGLHVEKHGISGDIMYDRHTKTYFKNASHASDFDIRWWNRSEPVWITAAKQGVSTVLYWWRGCQVPYIWRMHKAHTYIKCIPFKDSLSTDSIGSEISSIIRRLKDGHLRFVLINYEMLEVAAHRNGPFSAETEFYIRRISGILDEFQLSLTEAGLWPSTNMMVVSDHGQLGVRLDTNVQFVDDFLDDPSIIEASANDGAFMMIYPLVGKEYQVYQELHNKIPNVNVLTATEVSKRWWKHATASHISPIVLLADPGFGIYRRNRFQSFSELPLSLHGYDNDMVAMRGIFYARGADFKQRHLVDHLHVFDIYQLICHILALDCHDHDGSWKRVSKMLRSRDQFANASPCDNVFIANQLMHTVIIICFYIYVM